MQDSIRIALKNKRDLLVCNVERPDADALRRIERVESEAQSSIDLFKKDSNASLFLDKKAETTTDMVVEFQHIKRIAVSFGTKGTKHYRDQDVLRTLLYSLDWMYHNRYGVNEINGTGWRDVRSFNWHDWMVGSATALTDTLVILSDLLSADDVKKYLRLYDEKFNRLLDYGSNRVRSAQLQIVAGLLESDPDRVIATLDNVKGTYEFVDGRKNDGQGFYTDGSYIFHTRHPMNGTYGITHFATTVEICRILKGTAFARDDMEEKLLFWAENSFLPFVSKCYAARSVMGRHPNNLLGSGCRILSNLCEAAALMAVKETDRCERIFDVISRNLLTNSEMKTAESLGRFVSNLSVEARTYLNRSLSKAKKTGIADYDLTKVFYNEDRAVHHYGSVAYSLSASSSRIYNYECINHENMEGWYLGDGMLTCLGSNSDAYKDVWENIDPYRLPATTLDNRERSLISVSQRNEYLSKQDFVGGVEAPSTLTAAMILDSYRGDGEHIDKTYFRADGTQGGPPEKRDCSLTAKKGYFINGKIAVLLGAGISASDGADVYTVVDSRQSDNSVSRISENALYLDGFGGYIILKGDIKLSRGGKNGRFEEIVIDHGADPINEKYAFAYLPEFSEDEVKRFSSNMPFTVLSNTEQLQAVKFEDGTLSLVFYKSGAFSDVSVSEPLIICIKKDKLYISDPTQKLESAVVSVGDRSFTVSLKDSYGKTHIVEL